MAAENAAASEQQEEDKYIAFDDFIKVDLRVGQILAAEQVEKSEKLLKLRISLGEELGERQILAGVAKSFTPEELVGKKVSVVANLKPRKMMGFESQGMLLAASDGVGGLELLSPGALPPAGTRIS